MSTREFFFLSLMCFAASAARADVFVVSGGLTNAPEGVLRMTQQGNTCAAIGSHFTVGRNPQGVAISPDGSRVYVTNSASGTVSIIDAINRMPAGTVTTGGAPAGVAATNSRAYVATGNRIEVVDPVSLNLTAHILTAGFPVRVALNAAGSRLYATQGSQLVVIDTATNGIVNTVELGEQAGGVAVHPDGSRVYVTLPTQLKVVDTASAAVIASIPMPMAETGYSRHAEDVAVHPDGTRVYVVMGISRDVLDPNDPDGSANNPNGQLVVISAASNTVTGRQSVGRLPQRVAVDKNLVLVTNLIYGRIENNGLPMVVGSMSEFDSSTDVYLNTLPLGPGPAGIAAWQPPPLPPLPQNVEITGMEVTQGIQNLDNDVPIVAGRRTFVRIHMKAVGPAVPGVTTTLFAMQDSCGSDPSSCVVVGLGPLAPVNPAGQRLTIRPDPHRGNVNDSFLFDLPPRWSELPATIRIYAVPQTDPGPTPTTCRLDAPHTLLEFSIPTRLELQFVRLAYNYNGKRVETTMAEQQANESWIRRTYPLSDFVIPHPELPVIFDHGLTTRVTQTNDACEKTGNLCATKYLESRLTMLGMLAAGDSALAGMVTGGDGTYALIPQIGEADDPTFKYFTRGQWPNGSHVGAGAANNDTYAAHEVGHRLHRQHPVQGAITCDHTADDSGYPYPLSLIQPVPFDESGYAGFDSAHLNRKTGKTEFAVYGPTYFYDNMGYCDPNWTSDYTYRALYLELRGLHPEIGRSKILRAARVRAAALPTAGDWLGIVGSIYPGADATAEFRAQRASAAAVIPARTPGDYTIRLSGAGGATLADYPFTPSIAHDTRLSAGGADSLSFAQVVPFAMGTTRIEIIDTTGANRVLKAMDVSANAPVVANVAPQGPPDTNGALRVNWTASDPDGTPLSFDVLFTRDGGNSFAPLDLGVTDPTTTIDTSRLGGGSVSLRIIASDGVQTAAADSPPFTLPDKAPEAFILTPAGQVTLFSGQPLTLEGRGADPQDGNLAAARLAWSIPGRALGTGARLSIADLPVGDNTITLTATNSAGLSATSTVLATVRAADVSAPKLTAGAAQIGWHVAAGETQLQTAVLDVGNSGADSLQFTAQSSAAWLSLNVGGGSAPGRLMLSADPAGMPAHKKQQAQITLTAVGFPDQEITIPVTMSVGNTFDFAASPTSAPPPPPAAGKLELSANAYTANEGAGNATITITRSGGSAGAVSARLISANGTAAAGADYTAIDTVVNFADGDAAPKQVAVPVLQDATDEPDETVSLTLSAPSGGATLGAISTASLTIVDDDPAPVTPPPPTGGGGGGDSGHKGGGGLDELTLLALLSLAVLLAAKRMKAVARRRVH